MIGAIKRRNAELQVRGCYRGTERRAAKLGKFKFSVIKKAAIVAAFLFFIRSRI
jgi:hypothetical protein